MVYCLLLNVTEVVFTGYWSISAVFNLLHKVSHFDYLSELKLTYCGSGVLLNVTEVIFTGYWSINAVFNLLHKVSHFVYLSVLKLPKLWFAAYYLA
jgi:hypothetical protein